MVQSLPRGTEGKALWVRQAVAVERITLGRSSAFVAPRRQVQCCSSGRSAFLKKEKKKAKYLYNVTLCFQIIMYVRQQEMNTLRNEICWSFFCFFVFLKYTKEKKSM